MSRVSSTLDQIRDKPLPGASRWGDQVGVPRPASNAEMNHLLPRDTPVHTWYRFVLSFPPHLVRDYAGRFGLNGGHLLLDPFCGTGTTLVEAKKLGIPSVGVEALPVAHLATQTKINWRPDPDHLVDHAESVAARARAVFEADGITDAPMEQIPDGVRLRRLPEEHFRLLVKNSISPLPLHKTLVLLEAIKNEQDPRVLNHERLALASILPSRIGNLRFGPEVGVGRIKPDAPVVSTWLEGIRRMADDLRTVACMAGAPASVQRGDARRIDQHLEAGSVDAVITSPTYPNEKDYTRTVRLETVLLGYMESRGDLQNSKKQLVRSNTRGVYKDDGDDRWIPIDSVIHKVADSIEARRLELAKNSGFERTYHRVTRLYFGGMARHLKGLRKVLRPGARLAYVVGDQASYLPVMIRTGQLLAEVAHDLGYEVEGIDLFRTRMDTATNQQLREEVLLLRWPG